MPNLAQLQEAFQKNGHRLTTQRQAVLDVLQTEPGLLTAEDIYQKTRALNPSINLATVYRTLTLLREMRLVEHAYASPEHHEAGFILVAPIGAEVEGTGSCLDDTPSLPLAASPTEKHFHFRCLRCGKLIQFQSAAITDALTTVPALRQVQLDQVCMCIQGICEDCAQPNRKQP
jgi:Fur family ferric uptake transcriptional regulator